MSVVHAGLVLVPLLDLAECHSAGGAVEEVDHVDVVDHLAMSDSDSPSSEQLGQA
jgi:hypothetical protein